MGWFFLFPHFTFYLFLLLTHFPSHTYTLCNHHDSSALLQFKNSFIISSTSDYYECDSSSFTSQTESWKNGTDCCEWDGVTCNNLSGHVIGLDLSCGHLEGELYSNSTLFQLRHLQQLDLAYNDFFGSLHSGIGDLVSLTHLNLSYSGIGGDIPSEISHLSKLVSLSLGYGPLSLDPSTWKKLILNATNLREIHLKRVNMSSIKVSSLSLLMNLSSSLVSLTLPATRLQGNFPIEILSLPNLQQLDLSLNTDLSVQLPKSNWSAPLRYLELSNTASYGEIPNSIGHLKYLNHLSLDGCHFVGLIPPSLWNLTQMTYLTLSSNNFQGYLPIPPNSVQYFLASNNNFSGNIASTLCNTSSLSVLNLAHNNLRGMIPQCLGSFPSLSVLDLQMNNLYGSMPRNFSKENAFETIKLNGNKLEGPLPQSLAHCTNLEVLDLGDNNIEDAFPNWLETLQELQVLSLRLNKLHGAITCSSVKHPFPKLRIFDVSNNNFCGLLPIANIMHQELSRNGESE